ncbi:EpsG family protein [Clostridium estertheticum]|uniref:EpsG family protein n=1 Tax=Clostridium estertheticum TaxID=238834 RepID=UPI001C0A9959|nr:EpsG family protein [Clostridium estertheticum]MBU3073201.1 EpsG family protein [Clostridium estertheticum]MBU3163558.1 EpsG family protein [Clostridium estertheticum]
MTLYLMIFAILSMLTFLEFTGYLKYSMKKNIAFFICVFFMFLSTIRWESGTDWNSYYNFFKYTSGWSSNGYNEFEIGYTLLNILIKNIFNNYTFFLLAGSIIIGIVQYKSIIRYNFQNNDYNIQKVYQHNKDNQLLQSPIFSLLVLWSLYLGNVFFVRSTIAYTILFYSIRFIQKKKLLKFIFSVLLAMSIHMTALFFLPAYYIYHCNIRKKTIVLIILAVVLPMYFWGGNVIGMIANLMGGSFKEKAMFYINAGNELSYGSAYSSSFVYLKGISNIVFILIIGVIVYKRCKKYDQYKGFFKLYFVGSIMTILTIFQSNAMTRLATPYMMSQVILLPYIFNCIRNKYAKIIVYFIFIVYLFLRMNMQLNSYYDLYVPFKSIFT